MAVSNPERKIVVLWIVAAGMITWRELRAGQIPPSPFAYVAPGVVYGAATLIGEAAPDVGFYFAVAWTLYIATSLVGDQAPGRRIAARAKPKPTPAAPGSPSPKPTPSRVRPAASAPRRIGAGSRGVPRRTRIVQTRKGKA